MDFEDAERTLRREVARLRGWTFEQFLALEGGRTETVRSDSGVEYLLDVSVLDRSGDHHSKEERLEIELEILPHLRHLRFAPRVGTDVELRRGEAFAGEVTEIWRSSGEADRRAGVAIFAVAAVAAAAWFFLACGTLAPSHESLPDLAARLRGARVAAHRGGWGFPDSNTVARFEVTRRQGADIVETDLRVSKDGVVFLFHDELLDKRTDCRGALASHTAAELDRCRLKRLDRGPDRFEDALRWSRGRVVIDAEFKTADAVRPAIDLIRKYDAYEWVYFQVGDGLRVYQKVRDYDSRAALEAGPRTEGRLRELLAKNDSRVLLIQLHPGMLASHTLAAIRAAGKLASLNAWLLEPEGDTASCTRAFALGIDVAVTDAPQTCVAQRDEARALSQLSK